MATLESFPPLPGTAAVRGMPPPGNSWTSGPPPVEDKRCDHYSDSDLDAWLAVNSLVKDVELELSGTDLYDAHTALRHVHEVQKGPYRICVTAPTELRKERAFSPWFHTARRVKRPTTEGGLPGGERALLT